MQVRDCCQRKVASAHKRRGKKVFFARGEKRGGGEASEKKSCTQAPKVRYSIFIASTFSSPALTFFLASSHAQLSLAEKANFMPASAPASTGGRGFEPLLAVSGGSTTAKVPKSASCSLVSDTHFPPKAGD